MADNMQNILEFDWINYCVFFAMLLSSTLIGIYFGCFGKKQTASEYLLGGKKMKVLPVALSLAASHVSGTTLIGVPAEVYTDGSLYWLVVPTLFFVCVFVSYFFIPVYCNLQITSAYEYLELRFNRSIRLLASTFYLIHCFLFLPPMIYVPSLSLSQVTGINLHIITVGVTAVCVFYTMIGGLKAVIWTDFLQTVITIAACLAIMIIGTLDVGGFTHVMKTAADGGKIDLFQMDPNPFQRSTFWTVTIGTLFSWTSGLASSQGSIQRFMSVPTVRDAQKVLIIYFFGLSFIMTTSVYGGLLLYTSYLGCDPIEQKIVTKADQMFPYFVLDRIGYVPALPGLFVAGVFSAALSSLSTALNTMAGTIYEDYIKIRGVSEEKAPLIMKIIVVVIGILCVLMVFVVEKLGNILPLSYIIAGVTGAPLFAMFLFGMLVPIGNAKGALAASFSSIIFLGWIAIGSSVSKVNQTMKPVYEGIPSTCPITNETFIQNLQSNFTETPVAVEDDVFIMFKLSYMLYKAFGIVFSLIVGIIVCYLTGPTDPATLDPRLISPPMRIFLPAKIVKECENADKKLMEEQKFDIDCKS